MWLSAPLDSLLGFRVAPLLVVVVVSEEPEWNRGSSSRPSRDSLSSHSPATLLSMAPRKKQQQHPVKTPGIDIPELGQALRMPPRPDITKDIRACEFPLSTRALANSARLLSSSALLTSAFGPGNASWEQSLAQAYAPSNTEVLVSPTDSSKHLIYLQEGSISNRRSKRKHLPEYIERFSRMVTAKAKAKA